MASNLDTLLDMAGSHEWLVAVNILLAGLLGFAVWRYRTLHSTARNVQQNSRELIEHLSEGIYRSTPDGRQLLANEALVRLNGYETERDLLAAVGDIAREWYVEPGRRQVFKDLMDRHGKVVDFVSEVYRHRTREKIWVSESARTVRDLAGNTLYYEGSVRDITETMKRLNLEEQFRKLMREVPGALFQFSVRDGASTIQYLSTGFERITGISVAEMMADTKRFIELIPEDDRRFYADAMQGNTDRLLPWDFEHRLKSCSGEEKWVRVSATPEVVGETVVWHGHMTDITQRKTNEIAIAQLAYLDSLTRLPNRRMFQDRMAWAIETCQSNGEHAALLFIDLDNFKSLNDTQGHDAGDELLKAVARRLSRCVGKDGIVARFGGDEFVVLVPGIASDEARATLNAITLGNRILGTMREPFDLGAVRYAATASLGLVTFDGQQTDVAEVLKRADIAMYQVKSSGRDGLALFDPVAMSEQSDRYRLLADLRAMLARGGDELVLHFQPQVDQAGAIVGAEALLRWSHPTRGTIYPDSFIPICEQFGLIGDVTAFVTHHAMATLAGWQSHPDTAHLTLALNVSVQSFANDQFARLLSTLLERYKIDGSKLALEVTERVMAQDQASIAHRLAEIRKLGVRLSLDDFGTGYSSLASLRSLPFDELKIDGTFVADIEFKESGRALVKTIIAMAQTLGLSAVAEHVETPDQAAYLRANGCTLFQGYLYGRAVPADEFEQMLRDASTIDRLPRPLSIAG